MTIPKESPTSAAGCSPGRSFSLVRHSVKRAVLPRSRARRAHSRGSFSKRELDSREPFKVRESENRILRPGRSTSLTLERDNIHTFEAGPDGALGFDLNTFLPGDGDWSMLELDDEPIRGYQRVFEARWIGKPS